MKAYMVKIFTMFAKELEEMIYVTLLEDFCVLLLNMMRNAFERPSKDQKEGPS